MAVQIKTKGGAPAPQSTSTEEAASAGTAANPVTSEANPPPVTEAPPVTPSEATVATPDPLLTPDAPEVAHLNASSTERRKSSGYRGSHFGSLCEQKRKEDRVELLGHRVTCPDCIRAMTGLGYDLKSEQKAVLDAALSST